MNRTQRGYKYKRPRSSEGKRKKKNELEEVLAPRSRRQMQTRCCYISPDQLSFAQLTNNSPSTLASRSQYQNLVPAEPRKPTLPESSAIGEPVRSTKPELITIASPNRPVLLDMITISKPKRAYTREQFVVNKKAQTYRPIQRDITATTKFRSPIPDEKVPHTYISHEVNTTAEQSRSTLPDLTIAQLEELRMMFFPPCHKLEKASQYAKPGYASSYVGTMHDDIDKVILGGRDEETLTQYHNIPKKLHISDIPRIKLMAVKFTKYKKDNIELRRIDEKVVCVEYDVFDKEVDKAKPVQKMRAFFSIKPVTGEREDTELTELPPTIKSKFNISTADLQKLNQKEIEIIDGKIIENQPYLDDLRKLLRRKEDSQKKNKNNPNLKALYEMGKRNLLDFDTNLDSNGMPKEELVEMQNFILKNCKSSVHGIRRRTVQNSSKVLDVMAQNTMSRSLVTELLRESNKNISDSK